MTVVTAQILEEQTFQNLSKFFSKIQKRIIYKSNMKTSWNHQYSQFLVQLTATM